MLGSFVFVYCNGEMMHRCMKEGRVDMQSINRLFYPSLFVPAFDSWRYMVTGQCSVLLCPTKPSQPV